MPEKEEMPSYRIEDISREIENGCDFGMLVDEVQKKLGKILSADELSRLFGIYDYLALPPEVIMQLVTCCIDETRRRYGGARMPTMRFIEQTAYVWEREGIFSIDLAEQYIKRLAERRSEEGRIRASLGITDRALSSTEKKYISSWAEMGHSPEVISLAYDKTVVNTGKLSWSYMNTILKCWQEKGLHTKEEVLSAEGGNGRKRASAAKPVITDRKNAPTVEDVERMEKLLNKIKGN
jgi:DnaD/phage-associated family protein